MVIFEDWYVNEKYMPNDNWKEFLGSNIKMNNRDLDMKHAMLFNKLLN